MLQRNALASAQEIFLLEQFSVTSMCEDGSPPKLHAQSEKWLYNQMHQ